jgi:polyhydroxybutyrate depolymerase
MNTTAVGTLGATLILVSSFAACADDGAPESTDPSITGATGGAGGMTVTGTDTSGLAGGGAAPSPPGMLPRGDASAPDAAGALADASAGDAAASSDVASADGASGAQARDGGSGDDAGGPVACPSSALRPGDEQASLEHDGLTRSFIVHVPAGYDNTRPIPLVLNFHGATMTAGLQQRTTGMNAKADEAGFVVVYPEGVDRSWNAGACCGGAVSNEVDDVGFARALVAYMRGRVCVDPDRIYATGFSNGGRMSYRPGCEAADLFAAIAPVAGTKSFPDLENSPGCTPQRPIPLLDIMGSRDSRIAAQRGQIAEWREFNGCMVTEAEETYREGQHACYSHQQCTAGTSVTYCIVDGLGHAWPRTGFSANGRIWAHFERSTL